MSINDISSKYIVSLDVINNYMKSVKNLITHLCNTRSDIISKLPILYTSILNDNIVEKYQDIVNEICELKDKLEKNINDISENDYDNCVSADDPTADGDLMLYFCYEIEKGNTNREDLYKKSQAILETLCVTKGPLIHGERFYDLYDNSEDVYKLIDIALNDNLKKRKIELKKDYEIIQQIDKSLELFDIKNMMNIFRQCFIQVMAYFDCCVFELLECVMQNDFFYWLDKFKNTTIKTHEMAEFKTFDEFRNNQIREMLKNCYVKDLLSVLYQIDKNLFIDNGKDIYCEIQELIGRRNVHIHNNGIADQAYISKYNLYKKIEGDYLEINEDIVAKVQNITTLIVNNIAKKFV